MKTEETILVGCEILCIPAETGLMACPLSSEEIKVCKSYLQYQAGIKEVVEWIINHYWPDEHEPVSIRKFYTESWQAKLKEWEIG